MSTHEHNIDPAAAPAAAGPDAGRPVGVPPGAGAYDPSTAQSAADAVAAEPALVAEAEPVVELDETQLRERAGKADAYLALAQRTQADFENFRKRMTRDVRAAEARGVGRLAKELLPALDNLDRAIAAVEASGEDAEHHLTQGIRLVQSELSSALSRAGIEGYAQTGERFDPSHHEAVAQQPVAGAEPGTIVQVLQSGYRLNDAVLRPARVIVAG